MVRLDFDMCPHIRFRSFKPCFMLFRLAWLWWKFELDLSPPTQTPKTTGCSTSTPTPPGGPEGIGRPGPPSRLLYGLSDTNPGRRASCPLTRSTRKPDQFCCVCLILLYYFVTGSLAVENHLHFMRPQHLAGFFSYCSMAPGLLSLALWGLNYSKWRLKGVDDKYGSSAILNQRELPTRVLGYKRSYFPAKYSFIYSCETFFVVSVLKIW